MGNGHCSAVGVIHAAHDDAVNFGQHVAVAQVQLGIGQVAIGLFQLGLRLFDRRRARDQVFINLVDAALWIALVKVGDQLPG